MFSYNEFVPVVIELVDEFIPVLTAASCVNIRSARCFYCYFSHRSGIFFDCRNLCAEHVAELEGESWRLHFYCIYITIYTNTTYFHAALVDWGVFLRCIVDVYCHVLIVSITPC